MKFRSFLSIVAFAALADRIDREKGLIKGVAIISVGAAKGHGVLCDSKTLEQVQSCMKTYQSGLKVKFNPSTFNHGEGSIAGLIPNETVEIEDGKLIGDFRVTKSVPFKEYIFDLAEDQPDTFGFSIDFSGDPEEIDGIRYARCTEIYAVTLVDEPAANTSGLFKATDDKKETVTQPAPQNTMTPEDLKQVSEVVKEAIAPLSTRLDDIEKKVGAEPDAPPMKAELEAAGVAEGDEPAVAMQKVKTYRAQLAAPVTRKDLLTFFKEVGGRPASGSAESKGGDDGKGGDKIATMTQFREKRIQPFIDAGSDLKQATALAIRKFSAEYNAVRGSAPKQNMAQAAA